MYTLVLAGSTKEALAFAKDVGLTRARAATSAEGLIGLRIVNVIELPSFWRRPDKHAILSVIRPLLARDRGATHVLYEEWVPPHLRADEAQLEGQGTLDEALLQPPVIGEVIQSTGPRAASQTSQTPRPTSVSAIKAARAGRPAR